MGEFSRCIKSGCFENNKCDKSLNNAEPPLKKMNEGPGQCFLRGPAVKLTEELTKYLL